MTNFIESVRSRKKAICDAEIGHRSATMCHLGHCRPHGPKIEWNPKKERFVTDREAAATISRPIASIVTQHGVAPEITLNFSGLSTSSRNRGCRSGFIPRLK